MDVYNLKRLNIVIASIGILTLPTAGCSDMGFGDSSKKSSTSQETGKTESHQGHDSTKSDQQSNGGHDLKGDNTHKDDTNQSTHKEKKKADRPLLKDTFKTTSNDKRVVTNPKSLLVCVDKKRGLPKGYEPKRLVVPDVSFLGGKNKNIDKTHIRKVAAAPLEDLFKAAKAAGIHLNAISGYRSYNYQVEVFARNVDQYGSKKKANQISAHPGQSEHQTGLTMDVSSTSVDNQLTQKFGDTKEGKWLANHAAEFGFIIRYLKDKEDITGYEYEPWHIRYVGKKAAKQIAKKKITLEEYLK